MKVLARLAAVSALAGGVCVAAASAETPSAPGDSPVVMTPKQGLPLDVGGKRVVGYFEQQHDMCGLTLVVAVAQAGGMASGEPDGPHGTRISVEVAPGRALHIDGDMNRTAEFFCGPAGRKMNARIYTREGYKSAGTGGKS
ncbi:MAG: hypothetical protein ABL907_18170 [Hyphomicrobium sp.]